MHKLLFPSDDNFEILVLILHADVGADSHSFYFSAMDMKVLTDVIFVAKRNIPFAFDAFVFTTVVGNYIVKTFIIIQIFFVFYVLRVSFIEIIFQGGLTFVITAIFTTMKFNNIVHSICLIGIIFITNIQTVRLWINIMQWPFSSLSSDGL